MLTSESIKISKILNLIFDLTNFA